MCEAESNSGKACSFPPSENGYCGRHQRNFQYAQILTIGKIPCRFFFRGCNEIVQSKGGCSSCKVKYSKKHTNCGHEGCAFKTTGDKYCKKHSRDTFRDEEKEKGIKYCDIDRGCFTTVIGYTKCEKCREISYGREKVAHDKLVKLHNAIASVPNSISQVCLGCGKDYEQFLTQHNKPSKLCAACNECNRRQDKKRSDRKRNYKNERYRNIEGYYKDYIQSAAKRKKTISIVFEDFKSFVLSKCYYCHHYKIEETIGIDRINNAIGYEKENCVPCCETCNMMKHAFHPLFFIELCKIISGFEIPSAEFHTKWKQYYIDRPSSYLKYKKQAEVKRKLPFHITKEEWTQLIKLPCYMCGFQSKKGVGLDRVDSTRREYTLDNVKPCCYTCNLLKKDYTCEQLKVQATLISSIWSDASIFESLNFHQP